MFTPASIPSHGRLSVCACVVLRGRVCVCVCMRRSHTPLLTSIKYVLSVLTAQRSACALLSTRPALARHQPFFAAPTTRPTLCPPSRVLRVRLWPETPFLFPRPPVLLRLPHLQFVRVAPTRRSFSLLALLHNLLLGCTPTSRFLFRARPQVSRSQPPMGFEPMTSRLLSGCSAN